MKGNVIFGGVKLPDAFDDNTNLYYYRRYLEGDMGVRELLISHNIGLVYSAVQHYLSGQDYDIEDIVSIGIIGLITAVDTFDITRNVKLSTYIYRCVKTEIFKFLVNRNRYSPYDVVSFDEAFMIGQYNEFLYGELVTKDIYGVEEHLIRLEEEQIELQIVNDMLNDLSERDRKIMMLYFGFVDGKLYKQREIAEIVGIGRAGVSYVIINVLNKMRKTLKILQENEDLMMVREFSRRRI